MRLMNSNSPRNTTNSTVHTGLSDQIAYETVSERKRHPDTQLFFDCGHSPTSCLSPYFINQEMSFGPQFASPRANIFHLSSDPIELLWRTHAHNPITCASFSL